MIAWILNLAKLLLQRRGQSLVEYGLILFMVALSVTFGLRMLGQVVNEFFRRILF